MKKIYTYILGIASLLLPSCSDYFDINTDPNNPSDVDYTTLVPTIQLYGTRALCTSSGLSNELIVYTHQFSTREEANEYGVTGADFYTTYGWQYMYVRALENLELAMDKASEANDNFTIGMLKVLKAYYYSQFVDVFGDIPFSEACKTDEGIQFPKYDKDSEIYPQLFTLLDEGIAALKQDGASGGDFDLYYGGNAAQWIKAANSIKLKLYTQVRLVQDVSAEVKALIDGGNLMASTEDGLMFRFGSSTAPDERHPGYPDSYATTQQTNHISPWFYEIMRGLNKTIFTNNKDPRIPYYFYNQLKANQPSSQSCEYRDGGFVSIYFGSRGDRVSLSRDNDLTVPGIYPVGGRYDDGQGGTVNANSGTGAGIYRNLTYADCLYLEAELMQAGVINGDVRAKLKAAMEESFKLVDYVVEAAGSSQSIPVLAGTQTVNEYITKVLAEFDNGNDEKKMEIIMTQKWIQNFGNAVDTYTDYRRTGYPVMFDPNAVGGYVTPPAGGDPTETLPPVPVACSVAYPKSLPYISDELNLSPNAPAQKTDLGNKNVFWDK